MRRHDDRDEHEDDRQSTEEMHMNRDHPDRTDHRRTGHPAAGRQGRRAAISHEPGRARTAGAHTWASVGNVTMPVARALPRRLLGVWAHPDDEAYLSAGLMGRVTDRGGHVSVITATAGERGTSDPALSGTEEFARHRRTELAASLAELGVDDVEVLGIGDGDCAATDSARPVAVIAEAIATIRPDAIVTFGPDGITWHPDHRRLSSWVTAAWLRAGRIGELLYATMTIDHVRRYRALHDELGLFDEFGPGRAAATSVIDVALACRLTGAELERKRRALARHASQTTELAALLGEELYTEWVSDETFRRPTTEELAQALASTRVAPELVR